jgi:hypothetical protein
MQLSTLHETALIGAVAFEPGTFHRPDDRDGEIFRPGHIRWYLAFSNDDPIDWLSEAKKTPKSKKSLPTTTSRPMKLVWTKEEGVGRPLTNKKLYVPPGTREAAPYHWSKGSFKGEAEEYEKHILKP